MKENQGTMVWIYLTMGAMFVIFTYLVNLGNDIQIKAISFFSFTYLFCFLLLIMLPFMTSAYNNRIKGNDGTRLFWLQDITKGKLIWYPIGTIGVFAVAYLSIGLNNPFVGILLSGAIMMMCFFRTHSILIPILIHGTYNAVVVLLQSGLVSNSFLSSTPISVPIIGVSIIGGSQLASEMIFQFVLVATAEELLKVLIIAFFIVNVKGSFQSKGIYKIIGAIIALVVWSVLHLISAIPH